MELKNSSLSAIEYYVKMGSREYNLDTLVGQKQLIEKCLELVARISSPIEVDFYIKKLAESFDVTRDAMYESFHRQKAKVLKKMKEENISNKRDLVSYTPSNFSLLAGFIQQFDLFDLFFENFSYNDDDLLGLEDGSLLYHIVTKKDLDEPENEELKTIEVYIDEHFQDQHTDVIKRHFFDLLRLLHTSLLEIEKNKLLEGVDKHSQEYLETYTYLVQKAKKLGIPPGKLTIL